MRDLKFIPREELEKEKQEIEEELRVRDSLANINKLRFPDFWTSIRLLNCLKKVDVCTIQELQDKNWFKSDIRKNGFGKKSYDELVELLLSLGLPRERITILRTRRRSK
jgi:DNA-directed RNA polymerase alpha subunit